MFNDFYDIMLNLKSDTKNDYDVEKYGNAQEVGGKWNVLFIFA